MSATAIRPSKSPVGSSVTPILRAVLLADLVDSTAFIERFGDANAASALQRLDLQIRDLLDFTGGRLIDKADGLLAIFERPIQAVDFALRYQQALRHFSDGADGQLKARVGIHVGELMTWRNTDDAVRAGAKPLEVEGLAKPVAARLMSLALPGQILLSSMAQTLAQRAQAELGERSERVRWAVHGRYRFKGVPAPLLVHEVGEGATAPMRAPASTPKAWRELPFWRRPPVVAVEALVFLAVVAFYGYALFRSPPALGFKERDWVVIGDVSNFTGDPRLEDALGSALRISLEQSRFVNVMPDSKVRAVLQRMGRSRDATVDRSMASEIALREGARAVLLPSIAQDSGKVRVSIEVVDPSNQATVFAESAEGRGVETVMRSIDQIDVNLRERLGESLAQIHTTGVPLESATTSNLDALRSFSLALEAGRAGRYGEALQLLNTAIELDPKFGMAYHIRAQALEGPAGDAVRAEQDYRTALSLSDKMTLRERLLLELNYARHQSPELRLQKARAFSRLYPDHFGIVMGSSQIQFEDLQQYELAAQTLAPTLKPQNALLPMALAESGQYNLALGRYAEAEADFARSNALGARHMASVQADVFGAQRRFDEARRLIAGRPDEGLSSDVVRHMSDVSYAVDEGKLPEAITIAKGLQVRAQAMSREDARLFAVAALALSSYADGAASLGDWQRLVDIELHHGTEPGHPDQFKAKFAALYGAGHLARLGDLPRARKVLSRLQASAEGSGYPALIDLSKILEAEIALATHEPDRAVRALAPRATGQELCLLRATLLRAYRAAGNVAQAQAQVLWLTAHRGRAYAEYNSKRVLQPVNVLEADLALLAGAELAAQAGDAGAANDWLGQFRAAWPEPPAFVHARVDRLAARLGRAKATPADKAPARATRPAG